jgi:hypothetical protein
MVRSPPRPGPARKDFVFFDGSKHSSAADSETTASIEKYAQN